MSWYPMGIPPWPFSFTVLPEYVTFENDETGETVEYVNVDETQAAFVRGYSLGTLPVGSNPQWDENEQTLVEHMSELGWVRRETCKVVSKPCDMWECECGKAWWHGGTPSYCPNCGREVEQ